MNASQFTARLDRIEDEERRGAPRGVAHLWVELAEVSGAESGGEWSSEAKAILVERGYGHVSAPSLDRPDHMYA